LPGHLFLQASFLFENPIFPLVPIPLPPFFFLLQTLSSQHPFCRFPLSTSAILSISLSHPLYPSQPSPLSIAAIPSIHLNHPLSSSHSSSHCSPSIRFHPIHLFRQFRLRLLLSRSSPFLWLFFTVGLKTYLFTSLFGIKGEGSWKRIGKSQIGRCNNCNRYKWL